MNAHLKITALAICVIACQVRVTPAATDEVVISVPDQTLALIRGRNVTQFPISTSKFGTGDSTGTYRTPLGTMFVSGKFGDHLRPGSVIKCRVATGEIVDPNAPGRDAIVSRVIWLRGMENENRHAHDRCIYIHGTPEERRIGKPSSYGCVRMKSKDIVALYDLVHIGTHVVITPKHISDFIPAEEPSLLARWD
jgi:lipoprotein-anchoring transpeptidase ErfK/SrfK